ISTAHLLAGEMPEGIEEACATAGISLIPARSSAFITHWSRPEKANTCKHVAARHYILADALDMAHWLIFRLTHQTQNHILNALRKRRGGAGAKPARNGKQKAEQHAQPFRVEELYRFWKMGAPLDDFTVQIRPPTIPQPVLTRLGEPEFSGQLSLQKQLEDA